MNRVVLISRDLLVDHETGEPRLEAVSESARLHRAGWRLVVLAPRPERWRPTRRSMDQVMNSQRQLHEALTRAGGDLDGVYYLEYGLFTRRRRREAALDELAGRYGLKAADLVLIARRKRELELAVHTSGRALAVNTDGTPPGVQRCSSLKSAVDILTSA